MDYKAIIKEQKEELQKIENEERIVKRGLLENAKSFLMYPNILAIIGVRRCGKSIFSYLIAKESNFGYINFDDERVIGMRAEELDKVLQSFYELYGDVEYIVLDEIQNVYGWELFVNRLRRTKKVIITGSNSKLLSGELATHLIGRYIDILLFPFSFREFLELKGIKETNVYTTKEKAEILNCLNEYLKIGGFPEVNKFGKAILLRIYDDIIIKDILLRYKIKKREDIRKLAKYLITNFSEEFSYRKLSKILGVKHISTISNWVSYLQNSFLILKLERFDFKLKKQFLSPKKVYCIDNGIITSISFSFSENLGRIIENVVAIELQRKCREEIYYWKSLYNEVDFLVKQGNEVKELIQVIYANAKEEIKEREIKSLLKASDDLKCENLTIITWDYENEETIKNRKIKFVPLWKWLLM